MHFINEQNILIFLVQILLLLGFFIQGNPEVGRILLILGGTIGFAMFCLTIGRRLADMAIREIKRGKMPQPGGALTFVVLLATLCGAITHWIGIHALFGFFLAGIMVGEARELSERTRLIISQMGYAVFVPLFFAGLGLKIDFAAHFDWFLAVFVAVIGIAGRYLGAWLGVWLTALPRSNRAAVAVTHTAGGEMEVIVGLLALQYGLITQAVFVAIVFGALFSSVILGPWLSYVISRRKEVSILEYLFKGSIIADLKASTRDQALLELSELAAVQERIHDAEDIYAAVQERESEMGTALEGGLAIPHARFPRMPRPIIVFGRSRAGIEDWDTPDGQDTHFIFLVLAPPYSDAQVQILGHIVRTMQEPQVREQLLQAEDTDAIWTVFSQAFAAKRVVRAPQEHRRQPAAGRVLRRGGIVGSACGGTRCGQRLGCLGERDVAALFEDLLRQAEAHGEQRRADEDADKPEGRHAAEYTNEHDNERELGSMTDNDGLDDIVDQADHKDAVGDHEDAPPRFPGGEQRNCDRDPDDRWAEGDEAQEEGQQGQEHGSRGARDGEADAGDDPLRQGGADHAVDYALHRDFHYIYHSLGRVAADSLHALAQPHHQPLAVAVEEEGDQHAECHVEKAFGQIETVGQQPQAGLLQPRFPLLQRGPGVVRIILPGLADGAADQGHTFEPSGGLGGGRRLVRVLRRLPLRDFFGIQPVIEPSDPGTDIVRKGQAHHHEGHDQDERQDRGRQGSREGPPTAEPAQKDLIQRPRGEAQDRRPQDRRNERPHYEHAADDNRPDQAQSGNLFNSLLILHEASAFTIYDLQVMIYDFLFENLRPGCIPCLEAITSAV